MLLAGGPSGNSDLETTKSACAESCRVPPVVTSVEPPLYDDGCICNFDCAARCMLSPSDRRGKTSTSAAHAMAMQYRTAPASAVGGVALDWLSLVRAVLARIGTSYSPSVAFHLGIEHSFQRFPSKIATTIVSRTPLRRLINLTCPIES
jgi:hypothetical protein